MSALPWWQRRMVAFDTETTGTDPEEARIVSACVVRVGGGELPERRTWLVNPGVEIPEGASAIHGITTERARAEGMDAATAIAEIARELATALGGGLVPRPLIIMNAPYDLTVLDRELRRHKGLALNVNGSIVDPLVLDKRVDRYRRGSRKLTALCEHYGAKMDGAHDAAFDAIAAARVAYAIAKRYQEIGEADLHALQSLQRDWYAEQAEGLAAYFRKQGKTEPVNTEWPMRSLRAQEGAA